MTARARAEREMARRLSLLEGEAQALLARIWDKVLPDEHDCYLYFGWRDEKGSYCRIRLSKTPSRQTGAARVVHELLVGPIPPGWRVRHCCGRSRCLNPKHLYLERR